MRTKEDDFSDDGNYFQCYSVGDIKVSKLVSDDSVYISANYYPENVILTYEQYSKLPHYSALKHLNGYSKEHITEEDLKNLYEACIEYPREYQEVASKIKMPEESDILKALTEVKEVRESEYEEIKKLINENGLIILGLTPSAASRLSYCYNWLNRKINGEYTNLSEQARQMKNRADSLRLMERLESDLKSSFEYLEAKRILKK